MEQDIIKTGYIDFDRRFGGFNRRELTAIASRPGMGKTAFILNLALNMVKNNQKIAVFHLEENKETTLDKIACITGDINYCDYLYGKLMRSLSASPSLRQIREKAVLKTAQKILLLNRLDILRNSSFISEWDLTHRDVEVSVSNRHGGLSGIYQFYFNACTLLFFEENQDYPDIEEIQE